MWLCRTRRSLFPTFSIPTVFQQVFRGFNVVTDVGPVKRPKLQASVTWTHSPGLSLSLATTTGTDEDRIRLDAMIASLSVIAYGRPGTLVNPISVIQEQARKSGESLEIATPVPLDAQLYVNSFGGLRATLRSKMFLEMLRRCAIADCRLRFSFAPAVVEEPSMACVTSGDGDTQPAEHRAMSWFKCDIYLKDDWAFHEVMLGTVKAGNVKKLLQNACEIADQHLKARNRAWSDVVLREAETHLRYYGHWESPGAGGSPSAVRICRHEGAKTAELCDPFGNTTVEPIRSSRIGIIERAAARFVGNFDPGRQRASAGLLSDMMRELQMCELKVSGSREAAAGGSPVEPEGNSGKDDDNVLPLLLVEQEGTTLPLRYSAKWVHKKITPAFGPALFPDDHLKERSTAPTGQEVVAEAHGRGVAQVIVDCMLLAARRLQFDSFIAKYGSISLVPMLNATLEEVLAELVQDTFGTQFSVSQPNFSPDGSMPVSCSAVPSTQPLLLATGATSKKAAIVDALKSNFPDAIRAWAAIRSDAGVQRYLKSMVSQSAQVAEVDESTAQTRKSDDSSDGLVEETMEKISSRWAAIAIDQTEEELLLGVLAVCCGRRRVGPIVHYPTAQSKTANDNSTIAAAAVTDADASTASDDIVTLRAELKRRLTPEEWALCRCLTFRSSPSTQLICNGPSEALRDVPAIFSRLCPNCIVRVQLAPPSGYSSSSAAVWQATIVRDGRVVGNGEGPTQSIAIYTAQVSAMQQLIPQVFRLLQAFFVKLHFLQHPAVLGRLAQRGTLAKRTISTSMSFGAAETQLGVDVSIEPHSTKYRASATLSGPYSSSHRVASCVKGTPVDAYVHVIDMAVELALEGSLGSSSAAGDVDIDALLEKTLAESRSLKGPAESKTPKSGSPRASGGTAPAVGRQQTAPPLLPTLLCLLAKHHRRITSIAAHVRSLSSQKKQAADDDAPLSPEVEITLVGQTAIDTPEVLLQRTVTRGDALSTLLRHVIQECRSVGQSNCVDGLIRDSKKQLENVGVEIFANPLNRAMKLLHVILGEACVRAPETSAPDEKTPEKTWACTMELTLFGEDASAESESDDEKLSSLTLVATAPSKRAAQFALGNQLWGSLNSVLGLPLPAFALSAGNLPDAAVPPRSVCDGFQLLLQHLEPSTSTSTTTTTTTASGPCTVRHAITQPTDAFPNGGLVIESFSPDGKNCHVLAGPYPSTPWGQHGPLHALLRGYMGLLTETPRGGTGKQPSPGQHVQSQLQRMSAVYTWPVVRGFGLGAQPLLFSLLQRYFSVAPLVVTESQQSAWSCIAYVNFPIAGQLVECGPTSCRRVILSYVAGVKKKAATTRAMTEALRLNFPFWHDALVAKKAPADDFAWLPSGPPEPTAKEAEKS